MRNVYRMCFHIVLDFATFSTKGGDFRRVAIFGGGDGILKIFARALSQNVLMYHKRCEIREISALCGDVGFQSL